MLQPEAPTPIRSIDSAVGADSSIESFQVVYQAVLDFVRRQYPVIAFAVAIMIALGVVYIFTTPPRYAATATMLIDSKKVQLFQQSMFSDLSVDAATVESQVEILKSDSIALAVIKKLNLADDPEFIGSGGGLLGTLISGVMGLFASIGPAPKSESNAPSSEFASTRRAVSTLQNRLNVQRVGLTYIITISFESLNADRAAQIANAVADAYIDDQLESKYQAARRAGSWLQARLRELREQASTAQRAVVDFKNQNNMIEAGGRTMNEQQLAELNSELVLARSKSAEAQARVDRVQAILTSASAQATVDATVADTLKNDVINKLRTQYLELSRRDEDWTPRYGADHLAVVNVRNQMREIQNAIRNELQRIAETYKSDLEIAKKHEDSVQKQLDDAVAQSQVNNQAQVALRELETNAQSYQALYDNFLQRYMESVQQQSFPITEARVISTASRPLNPSHPNKIRIFGLAALAGLVFGALAAAWREFSDRVFRTRNQVETLLQTDCIALVPAITDNSGTNKIPNLRRQPKIGRLRANSAITHESGESEIPEFSLAGRVADVGRPNRGVAGLAGENRSIDKEHQAQIAKVSLNTGRQIIGPVPSVLSTVVDSPFSAFAEAIRSVKVSIDLSATATGAKVIGFTSTVPNEGKSSIAVAVARLAAQAGARTLLVDCDLKNPSLSRALSPGAAAGLIEVVRGQMTIDKAVWLDDATKMNFLPVVTRARLAHSSEVLASGQIRKLFDGLRNSYDYIFLDFAPLMPIVDVRVSTHLVDGYVYVVEWGKTRIDYVEQALRSARGVYEHLVGVVLNKVDLKNLGRYDGHGGNYYHHGNYYHRYGYTE